jgi:hypothetical protein
MARRLILALVVLAALLAVTGPALYVTFTPGLYNGCADTATVWVSAQSGPCTCPGGNRVQIASYPTTARWVSPGQWKSYGRLIQNPYGQAFRCVRIELPVCYNDGSMAVVVR